MPGEKTLSAKTIYNILVGVLYGPLTAPSGRSSIAYHLGLISEEQNASKGFAKLGFSEPSAYVRQLNMWIADATDKQITLGECTGLLKSARMNKLPRTKLKELIETIYVADGSLEETKDLLQIGNTDRMGISFRRGSRQGRMR